MSVPLQDDDNAESKRVLADARVDESCTPETRGSPASTGEPCFLRWQKSVLRVVVVFGQLLDLVDERFCTALRAHVDGLIVEFGVVQHRLDLARELVAILGDVANSLEVVGIYFVGGSDGAV